MVLIRRLLAADLEQSNLLISLFEAEFDRDSLEPREFMEAEVRNQRPEDAIYLVAEYNGQFAGGLRFYLRPPLPKFLVHIATTANFRGKGVGKALLDALLSWPGPSSILLEMDEAESGDWWNRQGARVISQTYTQPAIHQDTESVPYRLMAIGEIEYTRAQIIRDFYKEFWRLSPDHLLVEKAVGTVEP